MRVCRCELAAIEQAGAEARVRFGKSGSELDRLAEIGLGGLFHPERDVRLAARLVLRRVARVGTDGRIGLRERHVVSSL